MKLEINQIMVLVRRVVICQMIRISVSFQVCVQGSMGEGVFSGMPLQLAGTRQLLEIMDWGELETKGNFISIGSIGMWIRREIFIYLTNMNQNILFTMLNVKVPYSCVFLCPLATYSFYVTTYRRVT